MSEKNISPRNPFLSRNNGLHLVPKSDMIPRSLLRRYSRPLGLVALAALLFLFLFHQQVSKSFSATRKPHEYRQRIVPKSEGRPFVPKPLRHFDGKAPELNLSELTFDDPDSYRGAIIEGWPPGQNRSMELYIRPDDDTVVNDISCLKMPESVKILIIVQSAPEMFERRKVNRETWMMQQNNHPEVKVIFLFGKTVNESLVELQKEQQKHCDMVQMDFGDHYSNVTLDTVMALKLFVSWNWQGGFPSFLVIADDDSYISINSLWQKLFVDAKKPIRENDSMLWGKMVGGAVHFPESKFSHMDFAPYDKWTYTPKYLFNKQTYPDFLSGAGYVLPLSAVNCLYQASLKLPYFHINDIFLTGFARKTCHLKLLNDEELFFPDKVSPKQWTLDGIVFHHLNERIKLIIEAVLVKQKGNIKDCGPERYCWRSKLMYCPVEGSGKKCEKVEWE